MKARKPVKVYLHYLETPIAIYIITIICAILMIIIANITESPLLSTVFISIGSSGIAAAIMAIFIDLSQKNSAKQSKSLYRNIYFQGLQQQIKLFFERVLWIDTVITEVDLDKDDEYYLSFDFLSDAFYLGHYEKIAQEEAIRRINGLINKYENDSMKGFDSVVQKKISKAFRIISLASNKLDQEIEKVDNEKFFLYSNDIVNYDDLESILYTIRDCNRFFAVRSDYGGNLALLLEGYIALCNLCSYDDKFFITWHLSGTFTQKLIEKRKAENRIQ